MVQLLHWAGGCSGLGFRRAMGNLRWQPTWGSCQCKGMSKWVKAEPNQPGLPFSSLDADLDESQPERTENTKAFWQFSFATVLKKILEWNIFPSLSVHSHHLDYTCCNSGRKRFQENINHILIIKTLARLYCIQTQDTRRQVATVFQAINV